MEARALLVGEECDRDRTSRRQVRLVQRSHDLEPGQHAVVAVVATAGADRVDVTAGHDGRQSLAALAQAGDVADRVDRDGQAQRLHPAHDQVAARLVLVGERKPRAAAAVDRADRRQGIEILEKM
jgi:hypothetical protein